MSFKNFGLLGSCWLLVADVAARVAFVALPFLQTIFIASANIVVAIALINFIIMQFKTAAAATLPAPVCEAIQTCANASGTMPDQTKAFHSIAREFCWSSISTPQTACGKQNKLSFDSDHSAPDASYLTQVPILGPLPSTVHRGHSGLWQSLEL